MNKLALGKKNTQKPLTKPKSS